MFQNSRIARLAIFFFLAVAVVATSSSWAADGPSPIVNRNAFDQPVGHSILEVADEETTPPETQAAGFSSAPPARIAQEDSAFDAPAAPLPRMTTVKPLAATNGALVGTSSGTFAGSNPSKASAKVDGISENRISQLQPSPLQPSQQLNSLRPSNLQPAAQDRSEDQPTQRSISSAQNISASSSPATHATSRSAGSNTIVTNQASAKTIVYSQISGQTSGQTSGQDEQSPTEEPKYESAYLHDQQQRDTPVEDLFSSPTNSTPLASPAQKSTASLAGNHVETNGGNFIQQTAYLSPAAPAKPQFQNNPRQQNNRQFGQSQTNRRGPRNQPGQLASQSQRTRQRDLNRQNPAQSQSQSQSQYQQQSQQQYQQQSQQQQYQQQAQTQPTDSTAAKQAISKFSFDANQQLAQGLPIRMADVLQQSGGRASRSQLIPQYWEVYYDWAQSVSAKHHLDWVESINAAQNNDASSVEVAKSNAQNDMTFTTIQLGKSQAKMKSLTGNAQPIVPMDSPTVTRVKTNYEAFKNRGMIAPKFEGIDATLNQMHALIASRANTVAMAQNNAEEAKQLYSRNQSTVDHVLTAGRTWRSAESDFIASVVEYNKAYADYALALPYGRGPVETVVNMLIVKPTNGQNVSSQAANGRPNLSNGAGASFVSQNNTSGEDYSVPYGSSQSNSQSNGQTNRTAQSRGSNSNIPNHANHRRASNSDGPMPDGPSATGQSSSANSLMQSGKNRPTTRRSAPSTAGFNAGSDTTGRSAANAMSERSSAGTNFIKRPSQFPAQQPTAPANPFSSAAGSNQSAAPNQPTAPAQKSFQTRPSPHAPASDRTAARPGSPFAPAGSTNGAAAAPATTPKPPTSTGFSIGG